MIKTYLKIALRNINRHKGYSFINISGLTIGMAVCILIFLWVQDKLSFDRFHKKANEIYRVIEDQVHANGEIFRVATTPWLLGAAFVKDYPGVINFTRYQNSGSGGGMNQTLARALASNGFATLALAYFRYPGLPCELVEIPLEYFKGAIEWMRTNKAVQKTKFGLVDHSKGGECSLLLASIYDEFNVIAAWVPSAFVRKGVTPQAKSSWSFSGKRLPFISTIETEEEVQQYIRGQLSSIRKWFSDGIKSAEPDLIEKATIQVETIKAPIFLASDTDDRTWPSSEFCETIIQRLKEFNFQYEYKHIRGEKAGHHVYWPDFIPGTDRGVNGGNARGKVKWSIISFGKKRFLFFISIWMQARRNDGFQITHRIDREGSCCIQTKCEDSS